MGWRFAVTESVFSVMIITAQGSIGDKPRPVLMNPLMIFIKIIKLR
ncbi:homoserine/homoserine lactone efflux protein [Shigella flexneri CDC 796-83]|uniref:Homoserine/homoserine lactone efflux protein n=1 Tax=Shigella flexneri CDC 796-83 TaxID=945360 RepID=A0A6N3QI56_SHIFL|nr:homoserine/homoserine lactone efflux protein [Shigella flexneri CDC 796-83]